MAGCSPINQSEQTAKKLTREGLTTTMNKGQLIDAIALEASAPITKKQIEIVLTLGLGAIMKAVSEGDNVTLVGFGTFEKRDRQEREGRNPRTGEKMILPATKVPAFSAGKQFKDLVKAS